MDTEPHLIELTISTAEIMKTAAEPISLLKPSPHALLYNTFDNPLMIKAVMVTDVPGYESHGTSSRFFMG